LRRRRSGLRLPPSINRSNGLAFGRSFLSLSLLLCTVPSTIYGVDHSFLCHRQTHLKLPPPTMLSSIAFATDATIVVAVHCFRHCHCCCSQLLSLPQLSSLASSIAATIVHSFVVIRKFLRRRCPLLPHFPLLVTLFSPSTTKNSSFLSL
ncbi:hypothetical protein BHE74_00044745, partial [Ensete ventricosum]